MHSTTHEREKPQSSISSAAPAMAASARLVASPPPSFNTLSFSAPKLLSRQLASGFLGQKLRFSKSHSKSNVPSFYFLVRVQLDKKNDSIAHDALENGEHLLDDLCHWISKKIGERVGPYLPEQFDICDWLPSGLRSRVHSAERAATIVVRECLLLVILYLVFGRVGQLCRWLSRVHYSRTHKGLKPDDSHYQASAYKAMEDPLRAGLLLWQLTHLLHVAGPVLKLRFSMIMVEKVRSIGFIVVVTWFLFKWKDLVVQKFISQNRTDAPRFIAMDKALSLIMYYIAGSCIGEVSGFALRSVLAIGGVSGIAIGLAAKEIVGNFLGGVLLFMTRPFLIGDRVKAKSFEGWVEDIDFLHTKLLGYDRSPMLVPNMAIINEVIVNYSRAKCRQLAAVFKLRNEDIFLVDKITAEITDYLINHPIVDMEHGSKPVCYLKNMGPDGLELELLCCIEEKGSVAFYKGKQQILVQAAKIVTDAGACLETTNTSVVLLTKDRGGPAVEAVD